MRVLVAILLFVSLANALSVDHHQQKHEKRQHKHSVDVQAVHNRVKHLENEHKKIFEDRKHHLHRLHKHKKHHVQRLHGKSHHHLTKHAKHRVHKNLHQLKKKHNQTIQYPHVNLTGIPAFPPFEVTQGKSTKHPTKTTSLVANNTHKKKKKPIPTNTPTPAIDLSEISTMVESFMGKIKKAIMVSVKDTVKQIKKEVLEMIDKGFQQFDVMGNGTPEETTEGTQDISFPTHKPTVTTETPETTTEGEDDDDDIDEETTEKPENGTTENPEGDEDEETTEEPEEDTTDEPDEEGSGDEPDEETSENPITGTTEENETGEGSGTGDDDDDDEVNYPDDDEGTPTKINGNNSTTTPENILTSSQATPVTVTTPIMPTKGTNDSASLSGSKHSHHSHKHKHHKIVHNRKHPKQKLKHKP